MLKKKMGWDGGIGGPIRVLLTPNRELWPSLTSPTLFSLMLKLVVSLSAVWLPARTSKGPIKKIRFTDSNARAPIVNMKARAQRGRTLEARRDDLASGQSI